MAKIVTYQCGDHAFDYLHHPSSDPGPSFCPKCGRSAEDDANVIDFAQAIVAPHVSDGRAKALSQSADQTYRAHETSSAANMEAAAAQLGIPASELTDMKTTDMNSNLREGDIAMQVPVNDVSRLMAQPGAQTLVGNQGAEVGRYFADAAPKTGPDARSGAKAMGGIHSYHEQNARRIVAAGTEGVARKVT